MKKKIIIGTLVAVLIIAIVAANILGKGGGQAVAGGKVFEVTAKQVQKGSISSIVSASGVLEEMEKQEVYFDTPLKVTNVLVEQYQKVTKGQPIIEVDTGDLANQIKELEISKKTQELTLQKLQASFEKKSMAALESQVNIEANNVKRAENAYNSSLSGYEKNKTLFASAVISQSELDMSQKAVDDAKIMLDNAKIAHQMAISNLEDAQKSSTQAVSNMQLDLETQKQNLKATDLRISELRDKIKKINDSTLCPMDGVITDMTVKSGSFLSSMQPAFTIINPEKLQARINVRESDIKNIKLGQTVNISGNAIDKSEGITGKITKISPIAKKNMTAGGEETVIETIVSIDQSKPILSAGLTVDCEIITDSKPNAVLVSFEMLVDDKDGNKFVYVIDKATNTMHKKPVILGAVANLDAEAVSGLQGGEWVVLEPQPNFKDGAKVKIKGEAKK